MGITPIALKLLGPKEVLLEFERAASMVEVMMVLHALTHWDDLKIQTHCIMARCESLIDMFHEREESEREKQFLHEEKSKYQSQLGQVVERIGSQIEQLDRKIELDGLIIPQGIVTPPHGSPRQEVQQLVMAPRLPLFSGSEPTLCNEGTYDQSKFQVKGMHSSCSKSAVRSALTTSVRGEASELVGFVGFSAPLLHLVVVHLVPCLSGDLSCLLVDFGIQESIPDGV